MIEHPSAPSVARQLPAFRSKVDHLRPTYGFEDVSLAPGIETVEPADVELGQAFCGIDLEIPVIAAAMEKWGLSRRIALFVVRVAGSRPDRQVAGFMAATGFLSMWVSNTATTIMMVPIAASVIAISERSGRGDRAFATALLLAVAYAASIGGLLPPVGPPPPPPAPPLPPARHRGETVIAARIRAGTPSRPLL